jgi:CRP-like cAMP-binding protein
VSVATLTGDIVVIPNSQIARDRLRVYGADQGWLRIACELKLAYEHPPELVQKVLLKAVAATKGALAEPQPNVRLVSFEDFAVLYRVSFCIKDFRATVPIRSDFFANFWYIAERQGIVFPARYNHRFDLPADITRPRIVAPDAIADRLRNLGTFQRPIDALADLAARARVELFRKGETVLAHNQRGDSAYVVAAGSAQALDVRDGREEMIDAFAAGDLILYKSFFRGGGAPYLVRATADLEVIAIPFQEVEAALSRDMLLAQEVERLLTLREEGNARARAKSNGSTNGAADDADRVQILRDLFRV